MYPLPDSENRIARVTVNPVAHRPHLQVGASGVHVVELQKLLTHWRIYSGQCDGIFSDRLEAAVQRFQRRVFLLADGIVGPLTWQALHAGVPINMPELQRGSSGEAVAQLQTALQADGYDAIVTLGVFDRATEKAVCQFQRQQGLVVDGIVGGCTWHALSKIPR